MTETWNRGSQWLRWDPHIHTPGTLRNDQFKGDWPGFLAAIRDADPPPAALGITDYFSLAGYKAFLAHLEPNRPESLQLIFPNIEMRLTTETRHGPGINVHLLICPDDADHVDQIESRLAKLTFRYKRLPYPLTDRGLADLGRAYRGKPTLASHAAMSEGANQFKVNFSDLVELFQGDRWMIDNVLIAIAAGKDGIGGLSRDSQFAALREEMSRNAHVIFAASESERQFWLGRHAQFAGRGLQERPCLHGSDAHDVARVLNPEHDRLCWIRGDPTFESLRQTLVEPDRRVFVGREPPRLLSEAFVIGSIEFHGAPWMPPSPVQFNEGLVTIIGAKGSGKTALADLIALASGADDPAPGNASFLAKARPVINGMEVVLTWADGSKQTDTVEPVPQPTPEPRVQYLSQQFVERLSGPQELGEPLVDEIERVVFQALPLEDRMGCSSFDQLRDELLQAPRSDRDFARVRIREITELIARELQLERGLTNYRAKVAESERAREAVEKQIAAIPTVADEARVKAHAEARSVLQALQSEIAISERRAKELVDLSGAVRRDLDDAERAWETLRQQYPTLLDESSWNLLKPRLASEAFEHLALLLDGARREVDQLRRSGLRSRAINPKDPTIAVGISDLQARVKQQEDALGLDRANQILKGQLESRLVMLRATEDSARKDVLASETAPERRREAQGQRLQHYEQIFDGLRREEELLASLYKPLRQRLSATGSKLQFFVRRRAGLLAWVRDGEQLLDLRRNPFSERDYLERVAREILLPSWLSGQPSEARVAMERFLDRVGGAALSALVHEATPADLGDWMFSTRHIQVRYGIEYEGVPISNLSPGTRGVVLLSLYLSLDEWDTRPLLIDQPEENLDPSSVQSDLVPFFRDAAKRRQIIMVTHNANLVVNSDADQVIVASAVRKKPDQIPTVVYASGGLESPSIRTAVCDLLEGGEAAFRQRGRRYRLGPAD
jgi:hypothetical protein